MNKYEIELVETWTITEKYILTADSKERAAEMVRNDSLEPVEMQIIGKKPCSLTVKENKGKSV